MLKTLAPLLLAVACATALPASAQQIDPQSDLGQFRSLRSAGMAALDGGDAATAAARFDEAAALFPDSPSVLLLKAQAALQQRKKPAARAALLDYLHRGFIVDLSRHTDFNAVWDQELEDLQQGNATAFGDMHVVSTLPGFSLTDAMAYDPAADEIFAAAVRTGKITGISAKGERDVIALRPGVAAYGLGLRDGTLWAATAASRQTVGYDGKVAITSKVVAIDADSGQIKGTFTDTVPDRRFGHILLGRDDLYVADTSHGEILRLNGYQGALQVLVPEGYLDSPSGLAENEDASVLMVSDFISGLYRIDLAAGMISRVAPPVDGALLGISSLSRHGNDLIAIENGFEPAKVLRLHMSANWMSVESAEVLVRSDKLLAQPSQGLVADDHFIFVAKSQWANMDAQGNPLGDAPEPAVIGAVKLN